MARKSLVYFMANCPYCQEKAGIFRRLCKDCKAMLGLLKEMDNQFSFRELLDSLMEVCPSNEKIQKFLEADVAGQGSIQDHITARMTNQLSHTMGQPTDMDPKKVRLIRQAEKENPTPLDLPGEINPYRR